MAISLAREIAICSHGHDLIKGCGDRVEPLGLLHVPPQ